MGWAVWMWIGAVCAAEPVPGTIYVDATGPVALNDPALVERVGGEPAVAFGCAGEPAGEGALDQSCDGTALVEAVRNAVGQVRAQGGAPRVVWRGERLLASPADLCGGTAAVQSGEGVYHIGCGDGDAEDAVPEPVLGSLERAVIDQVVKHHLDRIKVCYQDVLLENPALEGKVTIRFVVSPDGSVRDAGEKTSTLPHQGMTDCLVKVFRQMTFPEPKGGGLVVISYPFIFEAPKARKPHRRR